MIMNSVFAGVIPSLARRVEELVEGRRHTAAALVT